MAHVQAIVQFPGGIAAQVDERGILGPSLPDVAKMPKTRRIRIDHLDRAQLSAEPGRDPAGLEPRRSENSVRAPHPGASQCARQFVLTVLAHAVIALFLTIWNQISNLIVDSSR